MYRIVITREEDVVTTDQVWQRLYETQQHADEAGADHTHGYVDKKVEQVKETIMLDQRVDDLDLQEVIIAVNNLNFDKPSQETTDAAA